MQNDTDVDNLYERILGKVLNYLSYGLRSSREIKTRLSTYIDKLTVPKEDKEILTHKILIRLEELSLINDKKVLDTFILGVKSSTDPKNKKYIKDRLFKRGFEPKDIEYALDQFDYAYEVSCAKKDLAKKSRSTTDSLKLKKYLLGKGHSFDIINTLFNEYDF